MVGNQTDPWARARHLQALHPAQAPHPPGLSPAQPLTLAHSWRGWRYTLWRWDTRLKGRVKGCDRVTVSMGSSSVGSLRGGN